MSSASAEGENKYAKKVRRRAFWGLRWTASPRSPPSWPRALRLPPFSAKPPTTGISRALLSARGRSRAREAMLWCAGPRGASVGERGRAVGAPRADAPRTPPPTAAGAAPRRAPRSGWSHLHAHRPGAHRRLSAGRVACAMAAQPPGSTARPLPRTPRAPRARRRLLTAGRLDTHDLHRGSVHEFVCSAHDRWRALP